MEEKMTLRVLLSVCLCGAVMIPAMAADGESGGAATNAVANVRPTAPRIPVGDPFAMRGLADGDGFVSAGPAAIPAGIQVIGILAVAGRSPVGALSIPGSKSLLFVREGDVIQIDRSAGKTGGNTDSQLYLLVKTITHAQIEIAPRTRPQDVRIYR
jgi:hypothetical protein